MTTDRGARNTRLQRADRDTVDIIVDGEPIRAAAGETLATTLLSERGVIGRDAVRSHGLWCGIGSCFECVVTVNGAAGARACMTAVQPGMLVDTGIERGRPASEGAAAGRCRRSVLAATRAKDRPTDLLVIGAGPAGLSAARVAGELGLRVAVVDENAEAGGQYYRQPAFAGAAMDRRQARGREAIGSARSVAELLLGCSVVALDPTPTGIRALLDRDGALQWLTPRSIILATGAYDTPVAFPGWTLPGVMSAGGAQALVKSQRVRPGRRAVVAGSGPFVFAVADTLRHAGVRVAEIVEATTLRNSLPYLASTLRHTRRYGELARYALPLVASGTAIRSGEIVDAAEGNEHLEAVRLRRLGRPGSTARVRVVEADLLCVGYGFSASTELARLAGAAMAMDAGLGQLVPAANAWRMTSRPGLFIAGEAAGLGGAAVAEADGELAAIGAALHLGLVDRDAAEKKAAGVRDRLAGLRRFAALLPRIFPRPEELGLLADESTIVCRCENVPLATILRALDQGDAESLNELKAATRCGQGWCQGRVCGAALPSILTARRHRFDAATPFTARVPIRPVSVAAIAVLAIEHRGNDAT